MRLLTKYSPLLVLFLAVGARADKTGDDTPVASLSDMTKQVAVLDEQVKQDLQTVESLRVKARKDKDVLRLNCINDKMVQLKAQINIYDTARETFENTQHDADDARPAYNDLVGAGEQSRSLVEQAKGCAGVPDLYKQESRNEFSHPEFPDDPTVGDPFEDGHDDEIEPPEYASPYS